MIASASFDRTVRLWDLQSGKAHRVLTGHTSRAEGVGFIDEGRRVVSAGNEGDPRLRAWDTATGGEVFVSEAVPAGLLGLTPLSDNRVLTGGKDGRLRVWRWGE
jgi:cytochrome c